MSGLFRDRNGRLRAAWRVGLFLLVFVLLLLLFGAAAALVWPGGVAGSLVPSAVAGWLAALAASWWATERLEGISVASLGLPLDRLAGTEALRGLLLGGALIGLACTALAVTGSARWSVDPGGVPPGELLGAFLRLTAFLLLAAWMEELLFRGYPLQAAAEAAGPTAAILATSVLFGLAHAANPGLAGELLDGVTLAEILPLLNVGLAGVVLGLAYWRTLSLWFATGVHLGWNWVMGFLADLPVSGLEGSSPAYALFDTPGWSVTVEGPELWTGGAFGPEGGLAVTAASLLGIAWLLWTDRLDRSLRISALRPLSVRGRAAREERARSSTEDEVTDGRGV